MCGIAGALATDTSVSASFAEVGSRMGALLAHRGPDGHGLWVGSARAGADGAPFAAVLAHRRLAVIDTSDAAAEPLPNEDGDVLLVFNGEIYNHAALRARLAGAGHRFRSRCDAEVIVHLYEDLGPACVRELRGMYAFAVLDLRRGELFLARDPAGKKPLHYWAPGGTGAPGAGAADGAGLRFAFASEIAPLLEAGAPRDRDAAAIDEFLAVGYIAAPRTGFAAIRKLPPGGTALFREGKLALGERTSIAPERASAHGWHRDLRDRVLDAVRVRLESDVPLGAFLSGGVDSTIVTGLAARMLRAAGAPPLHTFSIAFREGRWNESSFAHLAAAAHGTVHHERVLGPESVHAAPEIVFRHGEPFADDSSVATWHLARLARERVTVVLTGDGGDELFLGYRHHRAARALERIDAIVPRGARRMLGRLAPRVALGLAPEERYLAWAGIFPERGGEVARRVRELGIGPHDFGVYLPEDILAKVDRATMAHGLEARAPLLDRRVVALARAMPARLSAPVPWSSKRALKAAFDDVLPPAIARRRKMGFGVPVGPWLRGPLRALAHDILRSERAKARGIVPDEVVARLLVEHDRGREHGRRLWALLVLESWFRQMVDPPRPERSDW